MKKLIMKKLIIVLSLVCASLVSYGQAITGGGGISIVTGHPDSIAAIATRTGDGPYFVYRTNAPNIGFYWYDASQPSGNRWEVLSLGKLAFITITQAVDLDALEADVADLTTLSGVASNATTLGTFTGTTITDNQTVKAALQLLETSLETKLASTLATNQIFVGSAGSVATAVAMSGDATIVASGALTLANTGVSAASYGSATAIPTFTVDSKGRLTVASTATVAVQGVTDAANGLDIALSSNNVTIVYDFLELTGLGAAPANNDVFIVYDTSALAYKSITFANLLAGIPAGSNFVSADLTAVAARTHTMLDNNASALKIGSTGATAILEIITSDGAEILKAGNGFTVVGATLLNGNVTLGDAGADNTVINSINVHVPNVPAYGDNAAALSALGANRFYKLSGTNIYGLPKNIVLVSE